MGQVPPELHNLLCFYFKKRFSQVDDDDDSCRGMLQKDRLTY